MASSVFDQLLVRHMWTTDEMCAIFSDENRLQQSYDFEAALALEQAALGIIPQTAGQEIAAKARVENVDLEAIAAETRVVKHPLVPAVRAPQRACKGGLGEYVHGKQTAHELVYEAAMHGIEHGITLEKALMQNERVRHALSVDGLRAALEPTTYVGMAPAIVDSVLAKVKASGWLDGD